MILRIDDAQASSTIQKYLFIEGIPLFSSPPCADLLPATHTWGLRIWGLASWLTSWVRIREIRWLPSKSQFLFTNTLLSVLLFLENHPTLSLIDHYCSKKCSSSKLHLAKHRIMMKASLCPFTTTCGNHEQGSSKYARHDLDGEKREENEKDLGTNLHCCVSLFLVYGKGNQRISTFIAAGRRGVGGLPPFLLMV